jgi:YVTN family beta-propeller protein
VNVCNARGPHNRSTCAHNRNVGQFLCVLALLLGASIARGEWFEGFISLPDSLHSGNNPTTLLFNPTNGRTYVAGDGSDRLVIFDSICTEPVGSVRVGPAIHALCVDSATNTIYCASNALDSVAIVDGNNGTLIRRLWSGGDRPGSLCYNPRYDKVYCGNFDRWLQVIDAETQQPLGRVSVPDWPGLLACDPGTGQMFIGSSYGDIVSILDGANDSIVAQVPLKNGDATAVLFNPLDGLVYVSNDNYRVYIIDPALRQVVDSVAVPGAVSGLCLNFTHNKLYVPCLDYDGDDQFVEVVDCVTRSVVTQVPVGPYFPQAICYNYVNDKAYCATQGSYPNYDSAVTVIDGATDEVVASVSVGSYPCDLSYSPAGNRVFCANRKGRSVTIIDGAGNGVIAKTSICGTTKPGRMCWDSFDRRTYVASAESSGVVWVVDGVTDAVCDSIRVGNTPSDICYSTQRNKVYCANRGSGTVSVISCNTNDVVATVSTGGEPYALYCDSLRDKVYCANRSSRKLDVISCLSDSIIKSISVGSASSSLCYSPRTDRLYCANTQSGSISIVDCEHDIVAKTLISNNPRHMVCNSLLNFVYVACGTSELEFVDCARETIVRYTNVGISTHEHDLLAIDVADTLLLVASWRSFSRGCYYGYTIVNAWTGEVVQVRDLTWDQFEHPTQVFHSPNGYSYCTMDNSIWFLSSGNPIDIGAAMDGFGFNPYWSRVYIACPQSSRIAVIGEKTVPAVDEHPPVSAATPYSAGMVARGVLFLPLASGDGPQAASLLDISGRKALDLHPGANDVRALAPGVYFVREQPQTASHKPQAIRKVVVTK